MAKFNLQAFVDEEALKAIESLRQERDELRAALRQIGQGIDPQADQLQNWIAGIVDTALGEVVQ